MQDQIGEKYSDSSLLNGSENVILKIIVRIFLTFFNSCTFRKHVKHVLRQVLDVWTQLIGINVIIELFHVMHLEEIASWTAWSTWTFFTLRSSVSYCRHFGWFYHRQPCCELHGALLHLLSIQWCYHLCMVITKKHQTHKCDKCSLERQRSYDHPIEKC